MPQSTLDAFDGGGPVFPVLDGHVHHPLVRAGALEARAYQLRLARRAVDASLLVVLPTGLGKTAVALLAAAELLRRDVRAQALVLAPTRPLVQQHARAFRDALVLREETVVALTGDVSPSGRAAACMEARVVVSTPHALANDVEAGRVRLDRVGLLVVDEAHRAVGDHAYVPLLHAYRSHRAEPARRVLGLTASPGSTRQRIREVLASLGEPSVEAREREDEDVRAFVKETFVDFRAVRLPAPARAARDALQALLAERLRRLRPFLPRRKLAQDGGGVGQGLLLETGEAIRRRLGAARGPAGKGFCFAALADHAVAMLALHALELVETQGLHSFRAYADRIAAQPDKTRAQAAFLKDARVERAVRIARAAVVGHPKENALMDALRDQFSRKPDSLVLVFAQYRDTVRGLTERIARAGFPVARFVGQATRRPDDEGLTQEAQAAVLSAFAGGAVRVLVATSVAEEGLHVPSVDLVVFYEPVPSEIRTIQRRGRTGRSSAGKVLVLVTEDSRDEAALRTGTEREDEMRRLVGEMRGRASG